MHGFGYFSRIDELKDAGNKLMEAEMISSEKEYTDEEQAELDNVTVIKLGDENYKAAGSAGNAANDDTDEAEPQLGGMGLGTSFGLGKEMARTEGFQGSETVDEESCNLAQETTDSNKIDKMGPNAQVNEMFGEMFGKNYGADKHIHDVSKPHVDVVVDGIKVKKGW
jgi:hypothetical protein